MNRRDILRVTGAVTASLLVTGASSFLLNNEANELVVHRIQLPIRNLPSAFEGFRIAHLSDFHHEPYTKINLVKEAVKVTNNLKVDLIVLTGDYVWREVESIFELAPILAELNAPEGVISIVGNHDIWEGLEIIKEGFRKSRLPLMINQGVPISRGHQGIHLACLDDGWSGRPDLNAALSNHQDCNPIILLLHEPDLVDEYSHNEQIILQLAGHTHGGQVRVPGIGALVHPHLGEKYEYRLHRVNKTWLYVNPGIGMISVPLRWNCPPEVTEITLINKV